MTEIKKKEDEVKAASDRLVLEDALIPCLFGRFHIRLLLASLCSTYVGMMITSTSSYILPFAECDLGMTLIDRGILNAGPIFGFVLASMLSFFFIDSFGRRPILIGSHSVIFIFTILQASSQNYWNMLLMKVFQGVALNLCLIAALVIVAEFTHKSVRDRFVIFISSFTHLGQVGVAALSWALLPHQNWHFVIWEGYFELHSWNIYLYVCSVFSLLATILYCTIPESPRYLFYQRREADALEVLKTVYSENTGKYRDTYPIKTLGPLGIMPKTKITFKRRVRIYLYILKKLGKKPLVYQIMLFSYISFICHLIYSSVILWQPQLSTIVEHYRNQTDYTETFCTVVNHYTRDVLKTDNYSEHICTPILTGAVTYVSMICVSLMSFILMNLSGFYVKHLGRKLVFFSLFVLCALTLAAVNWTSTSSIMITLAMAGIYSTLSSALGIQKAALVNVFPTALRALGLSIIITSSRVGSLLGNILFPIMLQVDCMVPFLTFSIAILLTSGLVYFVQSENKDAVTGDK